MRKEADLEYTQKITLYYYGDDETKEAIETWADYIKTETLSVSIKSGVVKHGVTSKWEIEDKKIVLTIVPIKN